MASWQKIGKVAFHSCPKANRGSKTLAKGVRRPLAQPMDGSREMIGRNHAAANDGTVMPPECPNTMPTLRFVLNSKFKIQHSQFATPVALRHHRLNKNQIIAFSPASHPKSEAKQNSRRSHPSEMREFPCMSVGYLNPQTEFPEQASPPAQSPQLNSRDRKCALTHH